MNHKLYRYYLVTTGEETEFIGLCKEFPSLSFIHESSEVALKSIIDLVEEVIEEMEQSGQPIPIPQLRLERWF